MFYKLVWVIDSNRGGESVYLVKRTKDIVLFSEDLFYPQLFLGMYPDMYFTEQPTKEAIKTFRKKLQEVTNIIKNRNEEITLAYCYLSPDKIPNSVAIWENTGKNILP